jgi:hypothetical protein
MLLAFLAVAVAFTPLLVRILDRGSTTTIGVYASDEELAGRAIAILGGVLNGGALGDTRPAGSAPAYDFRRASVPSAATADIENGRYDAALVAARQPGGRIAFTFVTGEGIGADRSQLIGVGTLAVAILDWTSSQQVSGASTFQMPTLDVIAAAGPTAGGAPLPASDFAGRRIIGIVFVVLIFIILVIYGMWVAAGVVAEKASRVMELMISAASARQLVIGKVVGIGAAGLTQYAFVLAPAILTLLVEDQIGMALMGPAGSVAPSLAALSPMLLLAYVAFFVLGFALYALIYAAAGSLAREPGRGSPGHRAATQPGRDRRLPAGDHVPDRRRRLTRPIGILRPVLEPVRDAHPPDDRTGGALGARPLLRSPSRDHRRHALAGRPGLRRRRPPLRPAPNPTLPCRGHPQHQLTQSEPFE